MRTAAEQHWTLSIRIAHAGCSRIFLCFCPVITPIGIVFDAANGTNPIARNPDRDPSINIIRLLRANQIQQSKNGRSEEHTSELQSLAYLVCRLLLEKKNNHNKSRALVTGAPREHTLRHST